MITIIATLRTKPGMGAALEADFGAWSKIVKANEPGTLQYDLNRSHDDADLYCVVESYADDAAVQAHMKNLDARGGPPDILAGPPSMQAFNKVV